MTRSEVIQAILIATNGKRYLEIGVNKRENFDKIIVKQKIGVDPAYKHPNKYISKLFSWFPLLCSCHQWLRRSKGEEYFQMPSSHYFQKYAQGLSSNPLDVCFVDGLHTYAQSLEDALNCLKYLSPRGVIIMHDCNPTTEVLAHPAGSLDEMIKLNLPGFDGGWGGDVWKAIVYLRSQCPDLRVCVLDTDCGLGIITRGEPENMLELSKEDIARMTYKDLDSEREKLLNLKRPEYLENILEAIK